MAGDLTCDKFWVNKNIYHDAEKKYYENLAKLQSCGEKSVELLKETGEKYNKNLNVRGMLPHYLHSMDAQVMKKENVHSEGVKRKEAHNGSANHCSEKKKRQKETRERKIIIGKKYVSVKDTEDNVLGGVGMARLNQETFPKTSLAGEVAKARQHIKSSLECMDQNINGAGSVSNAQLASCLEKMEKAVENLTRRVEALEKKCLSCPPGVAVCPAKPQKPAAKTPAEPAEDDEDDDVDLFGSDNEDEEYKKIKEQRLQEYAAKKSKKPAPVAKSSIILDIKPWDDETDMKEMEKAVRAIEMDGLIWGASKLVPVAFKIFKLQIACVIEDDKVSVDVLTETLLEIEDYIQSVDIAAFNKV